MLINPTPAGDFRYLATFNSRNAAITNELGETVPTTTPIIKVWCKISPLSGKELIMAASNNLNTTHKITCRYHPQIVHTGTIEYDGKTYNITQVIDVENQNIELQMLANVIS